MGNFYTGEKKAASQHTYDNIVFGRQNYMEMGEKKYCKIKIWGKLKGNSWR